MKKLHAFYSREQEKIIATEKSFNDNDRYTGTIPVYKFPDSTEKVCTELRETKEHRFSDSIYLGEIEIGAGNYIKSIKARD